MPEFRPPEPGPVYRVYPVGPAFRWHVIVYRDGRAAERYTRKSALRARVTVARLRARGVRPAEATP